MTERRAHPSSMRRDPSRGGAFGYDARAVGADRWRVSFAGNTATPRAVVEDYLLYRAAEIAREAGTSSFVVVHRETEPVMRFRVSGFGVGAGRGLVGSTVFAATAFPADATPVTHYAAYLEIQFISGDASAGFEVKDADDVLAAMASRLQRPDRA